MLDHLFFATVAGAGFTAAGMLGLLGVKVSEGLRVFSAAVASGILLALVIAELVPEAIATAGSAAAAYGFAGGFIALFLVESVGRAHVHHHGEHGHPADPAAEGQLAHHHSLVPFVAALAIHNLADGFAVGASTELTQEAAAAVTAGVLIHQLPVGVSFAAVLTAMHARRHVVLRSAVLLGLAIPAGALIVALLPTLEPSHLGILFGAAAGALTYVGAGHLLPEAQSEKRRLGVVAAFPILLVATILLFTTVLEHEHGSAHDDEHTESELHDEETDASEPHGLDA